MELELNLSLPVIGIAVVALALLAMAVWLLVGASRRAKVIDDGESLKRDVLDEGAARAARNQALIDAAPAAAPAPAPSPATAPEPAAPASPAAPAPAGDDLTRIKGLGPKIAGLLGELGITRFEQIAAWSEDDIAAIDTKLGRFGGRITRDQWVAQAKLLAAGDEAAFTAKFGQN